MNPELKKKISDEFEKMFPKDAGWITCPIKGCGIDECGWTSVRDFILSSADTAHKAGLEAGKHTKIEQHKLDIEFERSQARQKVIAEIVKLVEGMKWKGNPELETNQDFGRNEALQKVIDCLKK